MIKNLELAILKMAPCKQSDPIWYHKMNKKQSIYTSEMMGGRLGQLAPFVIVCRDKGSNRTDSSPVS